MDRKTDSDRTDGSTDSANAQTGHADVPSDSAERPGGVSRRRVLAGIGATAAAMGLAGCEGANPLSGDNSGSGGGGDGGGGGGGGGDLGDPDGSVGENPIGGLAIVGLESYVSDGSEAFVNEGDWAVDVTLENTGGQETALMEYSYQLTLYDDAGNDLGAMTGAGSMGGDSVAPGETGTLTLWDGSDNNPDDVARYEVSVECDGFDEGVYCE